VGVSRASAALAGATNLRRILQAFMGSLLLGRLSDPMVAARGRGLAIECAAVVG